MNTHRNNPDSDEMKQADYANRRAVFTAQMEASQQTEPTRGERELAALQKLTDAHPDLCAIGRKTEPEPESEWRPLEPGEIIQEGDERKVPFYDWSPVLSEVGTKRRDWAPGFGLRTRRPKPIPEPPCFIDKRQTCPACNLPHTGDHACKTEPQGSAVDWVKIKSTVATGYGDDVIVLLIDDALELAKRCDAAEKPGWYQACLTICTILAPIAKGDGVVDAIRDVVAQLAAAQAQIDQLNTANNALRTELLETDKRCAAARAAALANDSDSIVASCNCMTKTNETKYHKRGCKSRLIEERDAAQAEAREYREALEWYESKAHYCNARSTEGESARNALAKDIGGRARAALAKYQPQTTTSE